MKKAAKNRPKRQMLDEYNFRKGVRGKYATRYAKGSNIVVLDQDIAEVFPDSKSVNEALRLLVRIRREVGQRVPGQKASK